MEPKNNLGQLRLLGISVVLVLAAYLGINLWTFLMESPVHGPKEASGIGQLRALNLPHEPRETMLTESIVSIIQNYYVDSSRSSNRQLMTLVMEKFEEDHDLELLSSKDRIEFTYEGTQNVIDVSEPYTMREFVDDIVTVSKVFYRKAKSSEVQDERWLDHGRFMFLNQMLKALDPHSALLNTYAYKELRQGTEGSFGGLGVVVGIKDNILTVIKPIPSSPAARAGIRKDDKIIKINTTNTFGATLDNLVEHMRGAPGTKVNISIVHNDSHGPKKIALKREIIQVDSVVENLIRKDGFNILRLSIESFSARTSLEVRQAIARAEGKGDLGAIILDLRSNPGGLLDQAVQVSDLFLKEGNIVSTKGRRIEYENAGLGYAEFDQPIVVLINGESASASEIVAGALKDNNRAIVIGQPSFGKGSVQTIFELPGDEALKLTIARYYTPSGTSIQNVGIKPHIWLQPLLKTDENLNMIGLERYRSEKFLKHRLSEEGVHQRVGQGIVKYYLVEDFPDYPYDEINDRDFELQLAISFLEHIAKDQENFEHVGGRRAEYFLAKYHDLISQKIGQRDQEAVNWLQEKIGVDWSGPPPNSPELKNGVSLSYESASDIRLGNRSTIDFKWKVSNPFDHDIHRASIFVQVDQGMFVGEVLIGRIAANSTKTGSIEVPIFGDKGGSKVELQAGVSIDGSPVLIHKKIKKVQVLEGPTPEVSILGSFVETGENLGVAGVLEPGEKGYLKVVLTNTGKGVAENVKLSLVNLSGKQISMEGEEVNLGSLHPGDRLLTRMNLKASELIFSDDLYFGVEVEVENMAKVFRELVGVRSLPNRRSDVSDSSRIAH